MVHGSSSGSSDDTFDDEGKHSSAGSGHLSLSERPATLEGMTLLHRWHTTEVHNMTTLSRSMYTSPCLRVIYRPSSDLEVS